MFLLRFHKHFHSTYERLKQIKIKKIKNRVFFNFHSTYERLKQKIRTGTYQFNPISTLPMRDWNTSASLRINKCFCISTLPMRDWNKYPELYKKIEYIDFHSTYERLKPGPIAKGLSLVAIFPLYLWEIETSNPYRLYVSFMLHFHSTYERLKQGICKAERLGNSHFHSTYERLKPVFQGEWIDCVLISTLPMRDWNHHYWYRRER